MDTLPLKEVSPDLLSELSSIEIDCYLSVPERVKTFLMAIKSPYLFSVKGRAVKVVFDGFSVRSLEDGLISALKNITKVYD
ncbi:MAG: hypothetical protein J1F33_00430 [Clostridiales bacterium]|nr:hypothetical protein [Clostridiales bacterium]